MGDVIELGSEDLDYETMERFRWGIRKIKEEQKLTFRELSAKTRLSEPYISRLLTGARPLSFAHLKRFSQALGVPLSDLIVPRPDDALLHDKRLTPEENQQLGRILWEIKKGVVSYLMKNRRKKH
jgi:transcriptional regulator with XRE-family HTH domain